MKEISREMQSSLESRAQESLSGKVMLKLRPGRWAGASHMGAQGRTFCRRHRKSKGPEMGKGRSGLGTDQRATTRFYGQRESEQDSKVERLVGCCR